VLLALPREPGSRPAPLLTTVRRRTSSSLAILLLLLWVAPAVMRVVTALLNTRSGQQQRPGQRIKQRVSGRWRGQLW